MTLLNFMATVAYYSIDLIAVLAVVGSEICLIEAVALSARRRRYRPPGQLLLMSYGGVMAGTVGLLAIALSDYRQMDSLLFHCTWTTMGMLLGGAFLLLLLRWILPPRIARHTRKVVQTAQRAVARRGTQRSPGVAPGPVDHRRSTAALRQAAWRAPSPAGGEENRDRILRHAN